MTETAPAYVPDADWSTVDATIVRLGKTRAEHDFEEGRWLLAARRLAVHTRLGFATLSEYVERRLGHDPRTTADKLRVAGALADLPVLREALRTGRRPWTAIRELVRVAVQKTEVEWMEATEHKTVRDIEHLVSGLRPGDGPGTPKDPALRTHLVRLELTPELFARFRDAVDHMRKEVDGDLSDEEAVSAMVDRILGGPSDEGRSPYQVSVTTCDHCGRTWQRSRGELLEVEASVGERAHCDGQVIGRVHAPDAPHVGEGASPTAAHVGHVRALQTVSPRLRRLVLARAQGRCQAPGCRNTRHLHLHHVVRRADGGTNDEDQIAVLCSTHHRLLHDGRLVIEGRYSTGFSFLHADGARYGAAPPAPAEAERAREAQAALRALGVEAGAARELVAQARGEQGDAATAEEIVRAAVRIRGRGLAMKSAPASAVHERPVAIGGGYRRMLETLGVGDVLACHPRGRAA